MTDLTERTLVETVRQGLDYSAGSLNLHTRDKLRQARLRALGHHNRWSVSFDLPSLTGGFITAAIVTLAITLGVLPNVTGLSPVDDSAMVLMQTEPSQSAVPDTGSMEVIMSGEDMDFLENLDMYEWLEAEYG